MPTGHVLVTGSAGFLGSYLVRQLLEDGYQVTGFDRGEPDAQCRHVLGDGDVRWLYGDIQDGEAVDSAVAGTDAVVHAVAIVDPAGLDPERAWAVNIGGTVNVLRACHTNGVSELVQLSSIGVLPTVQHRPIRPDHPIILAGEGPATGFYGASKVASEAFCLAANEGLGLNCRIVRPSAIYGLGMHWPMAIKPLVEGAVLGTPVHLAEGGAVPRDYTHAEDVASLVSAVLRAPDAADRVFYGATGRDPIKPSEVIEHIRARMPFAQLSVSDTTTREDIRETSMRAALSIENSAEQLGWTPRWADAADGVAHYIDQFRAYVERQQA